MKVFSGTGNRPLAEKIVKHIGIELGNLEVGRFMDRETHVEIDETVRGADVFLIQPTCTPVNENIMETLIIIDALKRASAGAVNAVLPYYGYARQDRKTKGREPITAKLVANLLTKAGADRVITMDLHAGQIQGYFDIPVDHLTASDILATYFHDTIGEDAVVVSPDLGGVTRTRSFADRLGLEIAIIEKNRPRPNVSEVMNLIGDVKGRDCILVDDIIDTGGTITSAAEALKEAGAKRVYISAVHGVLSGQAVEKIERSVVEKCVISDTIPFVPRIRTKKFDVVSTAKVFADAIVRIHNHDSVSSLFK
ncbi:MAG: ribose-phosphate pyrophosphokinase [Tissierellia bacterium]|nr:ribose-phosphate pyrophosphokinase [Bacillota bacterium]NLK59368.1 ribose-phosphate pyrophosphokinase [Tissierellia bacterium]